MKRLILLLILVLPLGYCATLTDPRSKAEHICSAIPVSAKASEAEKVIREAGIPELKRDDPSQNEMRHKPHWGKDGDLLYVEIPSVLGERWVCNVRLAEGRVSGKEVLHID